MPLQHARRVSDSVGFTSEVNAKAEVVGKTLAFTTITFKNSKGELAARGSHTKYVSWAISGHLQSTDRSRYIAQAWGAHPEYTAPKDMIAEGEEN